MAKRIKTEYYHNGDCWKQWTSSTINLPNVSWFGLFKHEVSKLEPERYETDRFDVKLKQDDKVASFICVRGEIKIVIKITE